MRGPSQVCDADAVLRHCRLRTVNPMLVARCAALLPNWTGALLYPTRFLLT